jgi:hypothetical protein
MMNALRAFLLAAACAVPALALAQWQWVDKDGRKVFSDRPPPQDVPAERILKQPGKRAAAAEAAPAEAAPPGTVTAKATAPSVAGSAPKVTGKDKALEDKKKQQEAEAAAKKKAEDEKFAQAKAENCAIVKRNRAAYESGVRIARTNAKGETEYLDDAQRASEMKRMDGIIARDCK